MDNMPEKVCNACKIKMPLSKFSLNRGEKDGHRTMCKTCSSERRRKPDKESRERIKQSSLNYFRKHPEKYRNFKLITRHGITQDDYMELFNRQKGVCLICGNKETMINKKTNAIKFLVVDHDHKTGKTRGLLCNACNVGLSRFRDNPEYLREAARYIENNNEDSHGQDSANKR